MKLTKRIQGWRDADLSPHLEISTHSGETLDLIVDSGFNGELVLPKPLIKKLRLTRHGSMFSELADGSTARAKTYFVDIFRFGQKKKVLVQSTKSDEGLLGTELFQGCVVALDPDANLVSFRKKPSRTRRGTTQ